MEVNDRPIQSGGDDENMTKASKAEVIHSRWLFTGNCWTPNPKGLVWKSNGQKESKRPWDLKPKSHNIVL